MSEQLFLEAFNSEPYFFEKEEKYGAMDIIYTFEDEAGHGFKFHFEKKVALGKYVYVCVLSQKTPGLKTYKRVIGKFSNPMRTVATLLAVVRDIHDTRKDVHGIVMSIPEQAFGSYARLVKKIMTRELRTVLNVEDGEYTPEDFEKMGLVGIVTTVKPRNMNTVYTGPALKEYQERQAAKGDTPAAVVPDVKLPVSKGLGSVGVSLTYSSDLANLEVDGDTEHGATIKSLVNAHLGVLGNISGIGGKFLARVDRENEQQLFVSIKSLVEELTSLGADVVQNSNVKDAIYKAKMAAAKQSDASRIAKQKPAVDPVAQVNADGVTTIKIEVTKFDKDADTAFNANILGRASVEGGITLRLMRDKIKKIAGKTGKLPATLSRSIFMEGDTLKARFDSDLLAEVIALIRSLEGSTLQFKGLERLEDLIPKQPVVDPVAVKEPYYFDYDHQQITLTFDNAEIASRVKEQLLELGAASFNDNEFFTDKEKLILVDGNALDVKKVQATLFPILGNPLMMNGVNLDPNVRSSVRSPDGVTYHIKGNTIQVEDAPKDAAMAIIREILPMADRIFDDKGSNTLELNSQGIADGFSIDNIAPVLKKSNLAKRLSAKLFRSWEKAVSEASDKYDLSTGDFGSSFTNNSSYLIDIATSGVVGEYSRTAGNVISGIVLKSNYKIREAVAKPLVALGFTVEYDVQGWRTQVKLPVNSDYTIPGTSELALFIKEVDNLANIARNRTVQEFVGGNKNFRAKWSPDVSRAFLILPTEESSDLGWRDYTAYATSPNHVRVDNIESYEEFLKLVEFVKNFDFGANLLLNIGVSKYLSDVRSGGAKASKTYKLKDGGEVEISFKFGDKVLFIFNQNSEGFDKEMSEFAGEKVEISGRASAIPLYMLGTADANKTLKNIDAWLDAHIVSKEDNASSVGITLNANFGSGNDYSASVENGALKIHDEREGVVATLSGINLDGVPTVVSSGVELHIREPEFKKSTFQGVVVDKTISVDNVKFVIKKADGTLIGRIELNSGAETPVVNKEGNSSKEEFKYGDRVIVNNARNYNSMATSDKVEGVVELVSGGRVYVKIGTGQSIVDPKDLQKAVGVSTTQNTGDSFQVTLNGYDGEDDVYGIDEISVAITGSESVLANMKAKLTPVIAKYNIEELKVMDGGKALVAFFDKYSSNSTAKRFIDFVNNEFKGSKAKAKVSTPPTAPKSKNLVKPLISAIESVSKDGKEKKVTGFDLRVGETWAYDGYRGEMNNLLFISGPESTSLDSKIRSLGGAVLLRGVTRVGDLTIEFEDVAKKRKSKLTFTCGGLVQGSFESLKGSFSPATKSKVDKLISKMFTDSPQTIANEFADFIGNPDLRYKIVKDARKPAILISKNPEGFKEALKDAELLMESFEELNEGIKEDLTGKAPNRVKRELLEATLRKLGLYRESFTYGNATFKTTMSECSVEIVPTSGNIRNFAKMLGARLGQELRIDDEGFLSFDLDNI